jgi:amino acid transporter
VTLFISGVLVLGYLVAATFFLRFRRQTGERLFTMFAAAFALLAAQRAALTVSSALPLAEEWYYVLRLLAYLLIIAGIVVKNRESRPDSSAS